MVDDTYPSRSDIAAIAQEIVELAVRQRAKFELAYGVEQTRDQARDYQEHGMARAPGEGTIADYAALRSAYSWIPGYFDDAVGPELDGFDALHDAAHSAAKALVNSTFDGRTAASASADAGISYLSGKVANWHGHLAETLNHDYVPRLRPAVFGQAGVALALGNTVDAYRALYVQGRRDLKAIGEAARDAIAAIDCWGGGDNSIKLAEVSAVATIVAGIATIPFTGGTSAAVVIGASVTAGATMTAGLAALGSAHAAARNAVNARSLGADTVDGVLKNMTEAIYQGVTGPIHAGDSAIADGLTNGYNDLIIGVDEVKPPAVDMSQVTSGTKVDTEEFWI